MLIVGLTGSIGMGKSTAAARFRALGIAVFDADAAVHRLYDGPLANEIETAFPGTAAGGRVDRGKLSAALQNFPQRFEKLEAIVHPQICALERAFLKAEAERGATLAVLEVPLLFEAGSSENVDSVIVVSAPPHVQKQRVLQRPGMTGEKLDQLVQRQLSDAEKRRRADFVVDTSGSIEACHAQIDAIVSKLTSRRGSAYEKFWR